MTFYRLMTDADYLPACEMELRDSDKAELQAATGLDWREALRKSIDYSWLTWVVIHQGKVEAVFGLGEWQSPSQVRIGIPWFLATDKFREFAYPFVRQSRRVIREMLQSATVLLNYVDSRHEEAIRWLRWLGFTVNTATGYQLADPHVMFYQFHYRRTKQEEQRCATPFRWA